MIGSQTVDTPDTVRSQPFFFNSMVFRAFLLASVCFFSGLSGFAKDVYVSQRFGDDRNTGAVAENTGVLSGPVRTLRRALEIAGNGDRLILDPSGGPYRESITLFGRKHSGESNYPLIIEGQGSVLEGTEPLPEAIWQHYRGDVYRFQPTMQPIDFNCFHLLDRDKPLPKVGVSADATKLPELESGEWCLYKGLVYFRAEPKKTPGYGGHYEISYSARMSGITLLQVQNVRIHDLTVQGFQADGISAINGAQGIVLDNVVCRVNGRSGLTIGGASSVSAGFATFADNLKTQVLSRPYSKGILFDCNVSEDGTTAESDAANYTLVIQKSE